MTSRLERGSAKSEGAVRLSGSGRAGANFTSHFRAEVALFLIQVGPFGLGRPGQARSASNDRRILPDAYSSTAHALGHFEESAVSLYRFRMSFSRPLRTPSVTNRLPFPALR